MVTGAEAVTARVVTVNVALVAPAGIVTLAGTVATAVLLLERETMAPPPEAGAFSATLPVEGNPPLTLVGFSLIEDRVAEPDGSDVMPPQEYKQSETAKSPTATARSGRWREVRPKRPSVVQTSSQTTQPRSQTRRASTAHGSETIRTGAAGGNTARAVVRTVTVAVAGLVPSSVTARGVITQVEAAGKPLQFNVTVRLKPLVGVTVSV
jgi:hypothetical protein